MARILQRTGDTTTYEIVKTNVLSFAFSSGSYFENGEKGTDELTIVNSTGNYFVAIHPIQKILLNSSVGVFMVDYAKDSIYENYGYDTGTNYIISYSFCDQKIPDSCYGIKSNGRNVNEYIEYQPMRFCQYD